MLDPDVGIRWLATATVAVALVSTGCVGVVGSDSAASQTEASGEAAADGTASHRNLTVAVVDANATWTPGTVEVTVEINGSVTRDGDPVGYASVGGVVNVSAPECWSCGGGAPPGSTKVVKRVYQEHTSSEGRFSTSLGPFEFNTGYVPPVVSPQCAWTEIWAWGIVGWTSSDAPRDTDHVWKDLCTQTYP